jgi:neutral ceramidase
VLPDEVMEFSGDYPGAWQRAVERATGGMAVFLAGGVGSHSPVAGEGGFAGAEKMGEALAKLTTQQLSTRPLTNQVAWGLLGLRVDLPELNVRLTDDWRLRPWLAKRLLRVQPQTYLQVFRLGNSLWISTPCDFSGELALGLKEHLRLRDRQAVITSFNGDYIGYVIPHRYYHLNSYESRLMSFFGPTVPDYFEELIRSMAAGLVEQ